MIDKNIFKEDELVNRFINYTKIDTQSDEHTNLSPSTKGQHDLASLLYDELINIGAKDVFYDKEHCYVYASIPGNVSDSNKTSVIGFISHMDTSDAVSGKNVKARIIEDYDGEDIDLSGDGKYVLSPKDFPILKEKKNKKLIVTDGSTLLGADDKAGIAEIMTMAKSLIDNPQIPHGEIKIAFTPDEEIGEGTKYFNLERFGADFAYTVDGGAIGELEYENFNACEVELIINGRSVHPGDAKGKMINASLIAYEFQSMLPVFENPMYTEKREGFYHLIMMKGTCEKAVCYYIIRDHDMDKFKQKKALVQKIVDFLNSKYGEGCVELKMEDSYYNMIEKIRPHMHLVDNAKKAMETLDVTPIDQPIRGGTDGAMLSYKGLPCPNLCTGGYNYHGRYEFAVIEEMTLTVRILLEICNIYGDFEV